MHFGASMFCTDYSMAPVELAPELENRGFESFWAPEHSHIPLSRKSPWGGGPELPKHYYDVIDPFVGLATAAVATKTLKLATGVCLIIQRDPIQLAKEVATLDLLSGGRFLFGIGAGWNREEMADHGTDPKTRVKLMAERVAMLKAIWTETKPEFQGEFQSFEPMMTWPKPVQKPHPPILVGAPCPTLPAAPLPTVTAGFRWGVAAPTYWSNCLASARWRQRPGAMPKACRCLSLAPAWMAMN